MAGLSIHDVNIGCLLLYLPSYSPDLNPIEESFSTRSYDPFRPSLDVSQRHTVKAYIRRHGIDIQAADDPIAALLEACGCITAEMAEGWFAHAGYITEENRHA